MHLEIIMPLIEKLLKKNNLQLRDIDAIAVTGEPGLIGALLIGVTVAKSLAYALNKPLITINHISAHLFAANLEYDIIYPVIGLRVSGGHTLIIKSDYYTEYSILGSTLDDAVGETFDKVAKMLDLGYPGGPKIEKYAEQGNACAINFPRPLIKENNYNFSFSGLKTAVLYYLNENKNYNINDVCASFQSAAFDVLLEKTFRAADEYNIKNIILGGGVAANKRLRCIFEEKSKKCEKKIFAPSMIYCLDNAAMVAGLAHYFLSANQPNDFDLAFNPTARMNVK